MVQRGRWLLRTALVTSALLLVQRAPGQSDPKPVEGISAIQIVPIAGEGAFNDIRRGVATTPVVLIEDQAGRPVPGAEVTFVLPYAGAGGMFVNGETRCTVKTDEIGRATAVDMKPNKTEGRFNIQVIARYNTIESRAVIAQSNTTAGRSIDAAGGGRKLLYIASFAGGTASTILLLTRRGGGSGPGPQSNTTTLSIGGASVGAPR